MTQTIFDTILKFIVTGFLGYAVAVIKNYKKKNTSISNALKIMLQNNLTNVYYYYEPEKKIPDYVYKNWLSMLKEYENLDGDDYVHTLADKMKSWEIVRTGILN